MIVEGEIRDGVSKRGVAGGEGLEILMERGEKQGISDGVSKIGVAAGKGLEILMERGEKQGISVGGVKEEWQEGLGY